MSKDINEIIYYGPIGLENDNIYEIGPQKGMTENKQDITKELIKNGVSKKIIIKSTGITEDEYLSLYNEVNK